MSDSKKITIDGQGWINITWKVALWTRLKVSIAAATAPAPGETEFSATGSVTVGGVTVLKKSWAWVRPPDSS